MPQKQNILKVFLIAVFCLGSFGAAGAGDAKILSEKEFLELTSVSIRNTIRIK